MSHPEHSDCPFCLLNGQLSPVAETTDFVLVVALDASGNPMDGRWLAIPKEHAVNLDDLPVGWGESLAEMVHSTGLTSDYNLSLNFGYGAGQRVEHLHFWVIDRSNDQLNAGLSELIGRMATTECLREAVKLIQRR